MSDIILHETQVKALDFLEDAIQNGKKKVGLSGEGGTGKSEILFSLLKRIKENQNINKNVVVSATTNRAASRLSKKIPGADTVHHFVAKPVFKPCYANMEAFFKIKEEDQKTYIFIQQTKEFFEKHKVSLEYFSSFESIQDFLFALRVSTFDQEIFETYTLQEKTQNSVIIIDEASMLPTKSYYYQGSLITIGLDSVLKVFDQVVLVGDMDQLPPIKSKSSFEGIETATLTVNFRAEKDLLRAFKFAREGNSFWNWEHREEENIKVIKGISNDWYKHTLDRDDVVHICYTNKTRHSITQMIRGDREQFPHEKEIFVWRGKTDENITKGEIGFFNEEKHYIEFPNFNYYVYPYTAIDGYSDKYARVAYGYALTAHGMQGDEKNHVIVHAYDIPHFINNDERRKWLYTSCSRARKSITIVL